MNKTIMILLGFFLFGCAAAGVQVKEEQLASLEKGKTTIDEVTKALGPPTTSTLNSDGTRMIIYSYFSSTVRPETYIPYVGAFIGGADSTANTVLLNFDSKGILINYTSSQSNIGSGLGAASKMKVDQNRTAQPAASN